MKSGGQLTNSSEDLNLSVTTLCMMNTSSLLSDLSAQLLHQIHLLKQELSSPNYQTKDYALLVPSGLVSHITRTTEKNLSLVKSNLTICSNIMREIAQSKLK